MPTFKYIFQKWMDLDHLGVINTSTPQALFTSKIKTISAFDVRNERNMQPQDT